jgi:putative protein kinase ArgK-like GTPase of G3E family
MTVASEGKGVPELLDTMQEIFDAKRVSGQRDKQRAECRNMEVVDWGLEMLRPYLYSRCQEQENFKGDPRIRAKQIVDRLLENTKSP